MIEEDFVFTDEENRKVYREKGFVVIPLLTDEELRILRAHYLDYREYFTQGQKEMCSSAQHTSIAVATEISEKILALVQPNLKTKISNAQTLLAGLIVKSAGQSIDSALPWHRALSFVDERRYDAAMMWIGLEEEEVHNWTFDLLPGTHKFSNFVRTAPKHPTYELSYLSWMTWKKETIRLKWGEALIFNHRVLNSSPANTINQSSCAIQIPIKVEKADWLYFVNEENIVQQYEAGADFYLKLWTGGGIDPSSLRKHFSYEFAKMNVKEFLTYTIA